MLEKELQESHLRHIGVALHALKYPFSADDLIKHAGNLGESFNRYHIARKEAGDDLEDLTPIREGLTLILGSQFDPKEKKLAIEALASPTITIRGQRLSEDEAIELFRILASCDDPLKINNRLTPLSASKLVSHVKISSEGIENLAIITKGVRDKTLRSDFIEVIANKVRGDPEKYEAAAKHIKEEIDKILKNGNQLTFEQSISKLEVQKFPKSLFLLLKQLPEIIDDTQDCINLEDHVLGEESVIFENGSVNVFKSNRFPATPLCFFYKTNMQVKYYLIDSININPGNDPIEDNFTFPLIQTRGDGSQFLDYSLTSYYSFKPYQLELEIDVQSISCRDITEQVERGLESENDAEFEFYLKLLDATKSAKVGIIPIKLS